MERLFNSVIAFVVSWYQTSSGDCLTFFKPTRWVTISSDFVNREMCLFFVAKNAVNTKCSCYVVHLHGQRFGHIVETVIVTYNTEYTIISYFKVGGSATLEFAWKEVMEFCPRKLTPSSQSDASKGRSMVGHDLSLSVVSVWIKPILTKYVFLDIKKILAEKLVHDQEIKTQSCFQKLLFGMSNARVLCYKVTSSIWFHVLL